MALNPIKAFTSSSFAKSVNKGFNNVCGSIGTKLERSPRKDAFIRFLNTIEPTGSSNSFPVFLSLMIVAVVIPRILAALKRNPDDKEATMDEIKEILFRDIQTITIILLATNAIAAIASGKMTSSRGLPLTDKPFEKVFNPTKKGIKGVGERFSQFAQDPIEKIKLMGKNLLSALNPMGGVNALNNAQIVSKYSGFNSISEIQKLFNQIGEEKGNPQKVFDTVMDSIITKQKAQIEAAQNIQKAGGNSDTKLMEEVLKSLEEIKEQKVEGLLQKEGKTLEEFEQSLAGKQITDFFKDENNMLVKSGTEVNALLKTASWAFNILYLGFGLPILNEKRLEKKYLKDSNKAPDGVKMVKNEPKQDETSKEVNSLSGHKLTQKEVRIFSPFVK